MSLFTCCECFGYTLQYIQCKTNSAAIISLLIFRPELLSFRYNKYCRTSFPVGKWPFEKQSTDLYLRHFAHCPYISVFHSTALWSLHVKTFFYKDWFSLTCHLVYLSSQLIVFAGLTQRISFSASASSMLYLIISLFYS